MCVASAGARQVGASLLQRQLPPTQVRPERAGPLIRGRVLLSAPAPHAVGGRVFGRHGSHGVRKTTGLMVPFRVRPLASRVAAGRHGERGGGRSTGAGGGERSGERPPASM